MPTRNVILTEHQDTARLDALREAARIGFGAQDRGESKDFDSVVELQSYLNEFSEKIIARASK